jgi:hypothetical protein
MSAPLTPEETAEYDAETVRLVELAEAEAMELDGDADQMKAKYTSAKKLAENATDELRKLIRERKEGRGKRPDLSLIDMLPAPSKWRDRPVAYLKDRLDPAVYAVVVAASSTLGELFHQVSAFDPAQGAPYGLGLNAAADVRAAIQAVIDDEAAGIEADALAAAPQPEPPPPELWRDYPLDRWTRFGVTAKDVEKMAAGEVKRETGRRPLLTVGDLSEFSQPTAGGYSRTYQDIKGIGEAGADRISEAETRFWGWWRDGGATEFAAERGMNASQPEDGGGDGQAGGGGDTETDTMLGFGGHAPGDDGPDAPGEVP